MRSATSKVGRLILVCAVSATVAVEPGPKRQSFQAGRWHTHAADARGSRTPQLCRINHPNIFLGLAWDAPLSASIGARYRVHVDYFRVRRKLSAAGSVNA